MKWFAPKGQINKSIRFFESKVSRRIDVLCRQNPMLTRQQAREQALREMADKAGSKQWEGRTRREAKRAADGHLVAIVRRAKQSSR